MRGVTRYSAALDEVSFLRGGALDSTYMLTRGDSIRARGREDSGSGRERDRKGVHSMGERSTTTSRRLLLVIACLLVQVESWVASFADGHGHGHPSRVPMTRRRASFQRRQARGGLTGSVSSRGLTLSAATTIEPVSPKLGKVSRLHGRAIRASPALWPSRASFLGRLCAMCH